MSRETEKAMKELTKYLNKHQGELTDDADINKLVNQFMETYNSSLQQGRAAVFPQTADDYLELAEEATTKKKKAEYLSKALELEPDNLDAACEIAEMNAKYPEDLLNALLPIIEKGTSLMEQNGFFRDYMGEFWGVIETRPYMRLRYLYLDTLTQCGMIHEAIKEAEELLRLCENDNLGVRYHLMHLFAHFEDEESALALHKQYDDYEECQMLLPLAILYYKKMDFDTSLQYLRRLAKINKDTKKFLRMMASGNVGECLAEMNPAYYQPFTIEELVQEYFTNRYLFDSVGYFFDWANRKLKKTPNKSTTPK